MYTLQKENYIWRLRIRRGISFLRDKSQVFRYKLVLQESKKREITIIEIGLYF